MALLPSFAFDRLSLCALVPAYPVLLGLLLQRALLPRLALAGWGVFLAPMMFHICHFARMHHPIQGGSGRRVPSAVDAAQPGPHD